MKEIKIAVIGLGYVGLPLARLFSTKYKTIGFDMNQKRVNTLMTGHDETLEVSDELLLDAINNHNFKCTTNLDEICDCNFYVVAVPTPIDKNNHPDLTPLLGASETVGKVISKGDIVVYESTVYPGVTEEECLPVVEQVSGLKFNVDFFAGYSPERINPGDTRHTLRTITKLIAASTPHALQRMQAVYGRVVDSLHIAPSIEIAEMAKLIENAQRDLNIAFVNEVAMMCDKLGLSASEVLEAARSKWNFLPFSPGLVGGHCISVDPYYLSYILEMCAYKPKVLSMGRLVNEQMPAFLARKIHTLALDSKLAAHKSRVLLLGLSFKENCRDMRNSKTPILRKKLKKRGFRVKVYDPLIDGREAERMFGFKPLKSLEGKKFDIIVLLNAHKEFLSLNLREYANPTHIIFDIKNALPYATHRL